MQKVGGKYADPTMRLVLIPTDTPTETMSHWKKRQRVLLREMCTDNEDGELMSLRQEDLCFELHVGAGADSTFTIDIRNHWSGNLCAACAYEFERDRHYLYDSKGTDIEPMAQKEEDIIITIMEIW